MYQVYIRNALILQLVATILYIVLSLAFSKQALPATYLVDISFGTATFLVSSLLAFWAFHHYR